MSSVLIKTILLLLILLSISFVMGCIIIYVMVDDEGDGQIIVYLVKSRA